MFNYSSSVFPFVFTGSFGTRAETPVHVLDSDVKLRKLYSFWAVTTGSQDTNSRIFDNSTIPALPRGTEENYEKYHDSLVSRWHPTAAARVPTRVWSSGICGGESGAGAGFLRVLRFPLPIFIPPNSPSS
jgi:hypothetical protein